jgi:hypothetical protein
MQRGELKQLHNFHEKELVKQVERLGPNGSRSRATKTAGAPALVLVRSSKHTWLGIQRRKRRRVIPGGRPERAARLPVTHWHWQGQCHWQ